MIDRIVREVPTCVMLKHEDWPGLAKISALRAASDKGQTRRISILCGNGGLFLPEEMGRGADGAMTGFCYPEMMVGVVRGLCGAATRTAHMTSSTPICRWRATSSSRASGWPAANMCWPSAASSRQRSTAEAGPGLSPADIADVERLLARQTRRLAEIGA